MRLLAMAAMVLPAAWAAMPAQASSCTPETFAGIAEFSSLRVERISAEQVWTDDMGDRRPSIGTAFCRVHGVVASGIGIEVWLPTAGSWNGKFLAGGVGGEAGTYNYADMARGLRHGYASASTDAGHRHDDEHWALDPVKRAAFASQGNHRLAVTAKEVIAAFYGDAPRRSYFIGCSGGGREGLKEAQQFPDDFDGIIAAGAGPDQLAVSARLLWSQYIVQPEIEAIMSAADWALISRGAVAACDAQDGVVDGVISAPRSCRFRPRDLLCKADRTSQCLSETQVQAAERIFAPLSDEQGRRIDQGLLPGVEITMSPRSAFAFSLFGRLVHGDPDWDPRDFNFTRDMAAARRLWPDLPNDSTDLSGFRARGGRLIYYHSWADPWILAQQPIDWFEKVSRETPDADSFMRLFMVAGMGHCSGGAGATLFGGAGGRDAPQVDAEHDMLAALDRWVETGIAPDWIIASRVEKDKIAFTRLLCPYPQHAQLRAGASGRTAADYICTKEAP